MRNHNHTAMTPNTTTDQNTTEAQTTIDARPLSDLTGFQRDALRTVAALDRPSGAEIQDTLAEAYGMSISHGRNYTALPQLVEKGLVTKGDRNGRANSYTLTPRGRRELAAHRRWMCSAWGDA